MKRFILLIFLLSGAVPLHAQSTPLAPEPYYNSATGGLYLLFSFYHYLISSQDGPSCIYSPTCSTYAAKAMSKHGIVLGSFLAADRLIRCNPSHAHGPRKDDVPEMVLKK